MMLPLSVFVMILILLVLSRWRGKLPSVNLQGKKNDEENKKSFVGSDDDKFRPIDIIKISVAGVIFLVLLYALVPEFVVKYHKEIIILVVAMIIGAALLGPKQENWDKNSARKILKIHYVILSIILISVILYKDTGIREWIGDFRSTSARTAERTVVFNLRPGEEMKYSVPPRHLFRIYSDERVETKTWDGRIYRDKDVAWLGDEIRHANFVLRSAEETKTAKVIITLRPK